MNSCYIILQTIVRLQYDIQDEHIFQPVTCKRVIQNKIIHILNEGGRRPQNSNLHSKQ